MTENNLKIRPATIDDAEAIMDVHYDSVHNLASADYSEDIIAEWARPCDQHRLELFLKDFDNKIRLVAQRGRRIVGFCSLTPDKHELGACYIASDSVREGVGRALINEIEEIARQKGLEYLRLNSSLTAKEFYLNCGYQIIEHSQHTLHSGKQMNCIKMRKQL